MARFALGRFRPCARHASHGMGPSIMSLLAAWDTRMHNCAMKSFLLALCCAASVSAQRIRDLATTENGSVVYFASTLRIRGSDEGFTSKIFKIDTKASSAVVLVKEIKFADRSYTSLQQPLVSNDESVLAYTGSGQCSSGPCGVNPILTTNPYLGAVVFSNKSLGGDGIAVLSRNGRYAAFISQFEGHVIVHDLLTGVVSMSREVLTAALRKMSVSSNGNVFVGGGSIRIFDGNQVRSFPTPAFNIVADDKGQTVVYDTAGLASNSRIAVLDRESGVSTTLIEAVEGAGAPSLSSDGGTLLFLSRANFAGKNAQGRRVVFLVKTDGSNLRQITSADDEITDAVLSGDGAIVYAATDRNRLLRLRTADGAQQELIPTTPALTRNAFDVAPGGLVILNAEALDTAVGVKINGSDAPLISATPNEIVAQVPLGTPTQPFLLLNYLPSDYGPLPVTLSVTTTPSALESPLDGLSAGLYVVAGVGTFLSLDSNGNLVGTSRCPCPVTVAHQDFQSLVTSNTPAHAGEIIHIYMTGLGAVQVPVPDGAPGFPNPLKDPLTCIVAGKATDVLYAGLAPGLVGVYQVDMRIPESITPGVATSSCTGGSIPIG